MPGDSDELAQMRARLEHLEREVADLRTRVAGPAHVAVQTSSHESRFGLTAVNRIGAFTLAIGVVFFFKYAVDSLWIGASGRVALGIAMGSFFLLAAELLARRQQRTFAQGIAGCGIATLYISVYAAATWYALLATAAAFIAVSAICGIAVFLSFRYATAAIAGIGLLGGILTPLLLHVGVRQPPVLPDAVYLLLLDATAVAVAIRRQWTWLVPIIAASACCAALILFTGSYPLTFIVFTLALAGLHFAAASRGDAFYFTGTGCLLASTLREIGLWVSGNIETANQGSVISELGSLLLALYGVAVLVYARVRGSSRNRTLGLFLIGLVIAKLYLWDVWFLERFFRTTAFVTLGVLLLAASWIYSRSRPVQR